LFYFDGTLLDSEREWDKYLWPLVQRTFPGVTWEEFSFFTGTTTAQGYTHFAALFEPKLTFGEYSDVIRAFIPALYETAPLNDGVRALLMELRASNIPMAITTSSQRNWILPSIQSHGIKEFFSTIVTLDDVTKAKPDPEPYLLTAQKLGVDPASCLVIEDSVHGVKAAKAAGMTCIGFAYRDNANELHEADVCVKHFDEVTLEFLQTLRPE
jgi:putative hydrolase of the HAD superfamily